LIKEGCASDYNKKKRGYIRPANSGTVILITRWKPSYYQKLWLDLDSDEWIDQLSPQPETLRKWQESKQTDEDWQTYLDEFNPQMKESGSVAAMKRLSQRVKNGETITILCYCKHKIHCHRYIIKWMIESLL